MNLRRWFRRAEQDRVRAEEIEAHINLASQHYIERGMTPEEAQREARLKFGNPRAHREGLDDLNRLPIADTIVRDLSYAVRMMRRSPGFSFTVVLTLALVIGATSAVFSLADGVLLRALPYPEPQRLALIEMQQDSPKGSWTNDSTDGAMWEAVRDHATTTMDAAVGMDGATGVNFVSGSTASFVRNQRVGAGFFRVIGIQPAAGREFTPDEDRPGGPAIAVLAHDFSQRVFPGGAASAIGQTILLKGTPHEVIGVMPEGFRSTTDADVWTPLRPSTRGEGGGTNYMMIARVRPTKTWDQAAAELASLGPEPFRLFTPRPDVSRRLLLRPLQDFLVQDSKQPIVILWWAIVAVLVIACVNIAALLIARSGSRTKEIATRMALGSGRVAVIRQLMMESALLAVVGGGLGVFVSVLALEGLKQISGSTFGEWRDVALDGRTLLLTAGLSLLTSVLFGLLPAFQASRVDLQAALTQSGARGIAGGARRRARGVLVVAEVALGVVLLVSAGLLLRQFVNLRSLDPGFSPEHLYTTNVSIQDTRYPTPVEINRLFDGTLERLQHTPGIFAAAVSQGLPYQRLLNMGFRFDGEPIPDQSPITNVSYITPGFFRTLEVPVVTGRAIDERDSAGSPLVVVVNRLFAHIYLKGREPIGLRLVLGGRPVEIVGIANDVQQFTSGFFVDGMRPGPVHAAPTIYVPAAQATSGLFAWFAPTWSVRATSASVAAAALHDAIAAVDPLMPMGPVRSMADVAAQATSRERLMMWLVGVLAAAAVLLAAIGLHGLVAQSVIDRRREFGVRLALGARPGATLGRVVRSGLTLAGAGALIGAALSMPATSLIASFLVDVPPNDPGTYVGVSVLFFLVAGLASVIPALRILKLDPARTLRE